MMKNIQLGKLQKVSISAAWTNEAKEFTPWLAKTENISLLGETLNLDLEVEAQEKNVGVFRADILCKDTITDNWVLIENQIARTDHTHLGQLITYASGLQAVTIVWIAEHFTDEHRAALDWLNEITESSINFFGLEIELWKIDESPLAPKFNIVSQPNDWKQTVSNITKGFDSATLTETKQLQLEYWTQFRDFLHEKNSIVRPQKPYPQHWMNFAIGRAGIYMSGLLNTKEMRIGVTLSMVGTRSKEQFRELVNNKDEIEKELGYELEWRELPDKTESQVLIQRKNVDVTDKKNWSEINHWIAETLEKFHMIFYERVKYL